MLESKLRATKAASPLSETDSADVLRAAGVPVVTSTIVRSAADAATAAAASGYPVVCKALAPGVAHKNEHGFVIANIGDAGTLQTSLATLDQRIQQQGFDRNQVPIVIQPMIRSQLELIIGVSHEPGLGHFLVAGLGGIPPRPSTRLP